MASHSCSRAASFLARFAPRLRPFCDSSVPPLFSSSSPLIESCFSQPFAASADRGIISGVDRISSGSNYSICERSASSSLRRILSTGGLRGWWGGQNAPLGFMAGGGPLAGAEQVRTIFVEVKGNDLDRAIRKWRRKCKEENLRNLKDREYHIKPSERRVLAVKERDRRIARRSFKMKLNWIMNRRQRGF